MAPIQQKPNALAAIVSLIGLVGIIWYFSGGGLEQQAARDMDRIELQVAENAVKQYEIAKRNGTPMDACVQAGMVSAAYLQAQDEASYQQWKRTERADCVAAGVSR